MRVYRIEREKHLDSTLQGIGASRSEGFRWNSRNTFMVYTSESRALAILEIAVHLDLNADLPSDRVIVEIEIPDEVDILELQENDLPEGWDSKPPSFVSQFIGDDFVSQGEAAVLKVPSSIVPQEYNYLINPNHRDISKIRVVSASKLILDSRLNK